MKNACTCQLKNYNSILKTKLQRKSHIWDMSSIISLNSSCFKTVKAQIKLKNTSFPNLENLFLAFTVTG